VFADARSKNIVFVAHCLLNQNSISDGTAEYPGSIGAIIDVLSKSDVGIVQMPCPELLCLGLDRGNSDGAGSPVVEENTRIRMMMGRKSAAGKMRRLVGDLVWQIAEYRQYGFDIRGIIGVNRSPSCGVETTSKDNREVKGEGVFIEALRNVLGTKGMHPEIVGIKALEVEEAVESIRRLIDGTGQKLKMQRQISDNSLS
jgi:predicted secreted protein